MADRRTKFPLIDSTPERGRVKIPVYSYYINIWVLHSFSLSTNEFSYNTIKNYFNDDIIILIWSFFRLNELQTKLKGIVGATFSIFPISKSSCYTDTKIIVLPETKKLLNGLERSISPVRFSNLLLWSCVLVGEPDYIKPEARRQADSESTSRSEVDGCAEAGPRQQSEAQPALLKQRSWRGLKGRAAKVEPGLAD